VKTLYIAEALASGEGRDGAARSNDGKLAVALASPVELGGSGQGTNPEQLFAAGYAACFHSALRLVGRKAGADLTDSAVAAKIHLGQLDGGAGFGLPPNWKSPCRHWTWPRLKTSLPKHTKSAPIRMPRAATSPSTSRSWSTQHEHRPCNHHP
jgi:Ohr subfamily peroxiredoxin